MVQMGTKGVGATDKAGVREAGIHWVFSWSHHFFLLRFWARLCPHWAPATYLKVEGLHCALYSRILISGQLQADLGV